MIKQIVLSALVLSVSLLKAQNNQRYYLQGFLDIQNNGFTYEQPFIGGFNSPQFQNMDINNDGVLDLIVFDKNDQKILPFLRTSGATFQYAPKYESYFPKGNFYYKTADLNGDGKLEIFTLSETSNFHIHKNITKTGDSFATFLDLGPMYYRNQYAEPFPILYSPLALSKFDLPEISDMDGDGDLDILTYDQTYFIYTLYSDVRADFNWSKDTFEFQNMDVCFGYFNEGFDNSILLGECPRKDKLKPRHTGGAAVFAFDNDEDGDKEIVLSNIGFKHMVKIENGKADFGHDYDTMIHVDTIFPSNTQRSANFIFPAGYLVNVDADSIMDLIVAPNGFSDVKETRQIWYYNNKGKNNKPVWQFDKDNFITEKNIDLGARSCPAFFDYDADGDMDLFVASNGDFEITGGVADRIALFKNTGSKDLAKFELINQDFLNLSASAISDMTIRFGDVDGDKVEDLLVGERSGKVRWYKNNAASGQTASFSLANSNLLNSIGMPGESNTTAAVFNYNNDTLPDLLVGYYNGDVALFVNEGSVGSPVFNRAPGRAYGMRANEWRTDVSPAGFLPFGYASPLVMDYNNDGKTDILTGTDHGEARLYTIDGESVFDSLSSVKGWVWQRTLTDSIVPDFGTRLHPAAADLDGDSIPEIVFGNVRGGLSLITSRNSKVGNSIARVKTEPQFQTFPNPADSEIKMIRSKTGNWQVNVLDISGRIVYSNIWQNGEKELTISSKDFSAGLYFIQSVDNGLQATRKVIVQHN